ncbi:SLAP domain-containing protein [Lactobacillus amylovorus]|uniref:SLAP domain-containing protein n=1 Tax=Lactobacillus amylovorus TaxID=1604 RepID=UPI00233132CB|nr:SLAP domain-containing protein [Lactobacillus amylovorus]MDB6268997.1 SLAP domain-containing protein [Lactobacillus amylovorus]
MKKNLRIVSVAAAALLAVAPVAATAMPVNAADSSAVTTATNSTSAANNNVSLNLNGAGDTANDAANIVNVSSNFSLNAPVKDTNNNVTANATLGGELTATLNGTTVSSSLANVAQDVTVSEGKTNFYSYNKDTQKVENKLNDVVAGNDYTLTLTNMGFSFGSSMKNKTITVKVAKNATLNGKTGDVQVTLDQYGNATGLTYTQTLHAYNQSVTNAVYFINVNSGTTETKGTWMTLANDGKLNVSSVLESLTKQYEAVQYSDKAFNKINITTTPADVTAELKKAGVDVDASGNFTAPDTFTVTLNAKSDVNGKTASLPVVVTVPNGKSTVVPSVAKTIMHNAYYYDKDAKRVGTDKLTRYNSVTVSPKTTTINGKAYYEVVENGKLSGKFINADNIDGTKRTLKHNAYVYASSKKRANKVVLKKGTEVTTYGGSYTFKNGKQYYKIGNNTDKTYVKASNF